MRFRMLVACLLTVAPVAAGQEALPRLKTVAYPVADLVVPLEAPGKGPVKTVEEKLIRVVQTTIAPSSWVSNGGSGSIEYYPLTMSLVVRQTPDVQEQIQDLLANLRRFQDTNICVELRFLTMPTEMVERLGLSAGEGMATLDESQVRVLLDTVQGDRRANIMHAPKVTMFNGQKASVDLTEQQLYVVGVDFENKDGKQVPKPVTKKVKTGLEVSMVPTVTPDQKKVTLQLVVEMGRCEPPAPGCCSNQPRCSVVRLEKTLKLSDGATALLSGWTRQVEVRNEVTAPVLSKIPYLSRLFTNISYGKETEHTLVLVTPRLIVQKETEQAKEVFAAEDQEEVPAVKERSKPGVQYVNKRSFDLSYDLAKVGPSKVKSVEVWVTRDGKSWEPYPEAIKPTGGVPITVKGDGSYGFFLVPSNGAGVRGATPKDGDTPHVLVAVDTVKPRLVLYRPKMQPGGDVEFSWNAEDENRLGDEAVNLYLSEQPGGPWRLIKEKQRGGGSSVMLKSASLPHQFYLRATTTDAAGNVSEAVTPEPVQLDAQVPTVLNVKVKARE